MRQQAQQFQSFQQLLLFPLLPPWYWPLWPVTPRSKNSTSFFHIRGIPKAFGNFSRCPCRSLGSIFCFVPQQQPKKVFGKDDSWFVVIDGIWYWFVASCHMFCKHRCTCHGWGGLGAAIFCEFLFFVDVLPPLGNPRDVSFRGYEGMAPLSLWAVVAPQLAVLFLHDCCLASSPRALQCILLWSVVLGTGSLTISLLQSPASCQGECTCVIPFLLAPWMPLANQRFAFLDVASIHQVDEDMKERGIYGLGGFLKASKELRILWSPPYLTRQAAQFSVYGSFGRCRVRESRCWRTCFGAVCVMHDGSWIITICWYQSRPLVSQALVHLWTCCISNFKSSRQNRAKAIVAWNVYVFSRSPVIAAVWIRKFWITNY